MTDTTLAREIEEQAKKATEAALAALDRLADHWAEETNLAELVKAVAGSKTLETHIDSLARQCFVEGAYRAALRSTAAGSVESNYNVIAVAYERGARWAVENREDYPTYLRKAALDYADKTTSQAALSQVSGRDAAVEECADLQFHLDRLDAWLLDLWAAKSIDLHQCDGTRKEDQHGLLSDIREDVMALRRAIRALSTKPAEPSRDAVIGECARVVDNLIGELASEAWDEACEVAAAAIRALASTKAGTEGMVPAALLREFRDHVSRHVAVWSNGGGSHHHPIWAKVADALEQAAPPAPAQGEE